MRFVGHEGFEIEVAETAEALTTELFLMLSLGPTKCPEFAGIGEAVC
jgi:hypothetical protein